MFRSHAWQLSAMNLESINSIFAYHKNKTVVVLQKLTASNIRAYITTYDQWFQSAVVKWYFLLVSGTWSHHSENYISSQTWDKRSKWVSERTERKLKLISRREQFLAAACINCYHWLLHDWYWYCWNFWPWQIRRLQTDSSKKRKKTKWNWCYFVSSPVQCGRHRRKVDGIPIVLFRDQWGVFKLNKTEILGFEDMWKICVLWCPSLHQVKQS